VREGGAGGLEWTFAFGELVWIGFDLLGKVTDRGDGGEGRIPGLGCSFVARVFAAGGSGLRRRAWRRRSRALRQWRGNGADESAVWALSW
jgi:hypothetical protein